MGSIRDRILFYNDCIKIRSTDMDLPVELKSLIQTMKDYALTEEEKWYEKLGDSYYLVKNATEEFTLEGVNYILYPEVVCRTQAFFEHMMLHKFEAVLLDMGATYMHCTGMLD